VCVCVCVCVCSRAGGGCRRGSPPFQLRGSWGVTPEIFFENFDAKSRVWGQFGSENKLIEGQPNEYDVICRNASVLAVPPVANDICRSAVPAPKYLPERRSTAFPHQYTPGCMAKIYRVIRIKNKSASSVSLRKCPYDR